MAGYRKVTIVAAGALAISLGLAACGGNGVAPAETPAIANAAPTDITYTLHVEGMT